MYDKTDYNKKKRRRRRRNKGKKKTLTTTNPQGEKLESESKSVQLLIPAISGGNAETAPDPGQDIYLRSL